MSPGGSSPRGRGKLWVWVCIGGCGGLIPAWAGKTVCVCDGCVCVRAHPRVGGENCAPQAASISAAGSSPRGRGKLINGISSMFGSGLIPAWAGKTSFRVNGYSMATAHPRVGGENQIADLVPNAFEGSSPRGRGKPALAQGAITYLRLIPAWAGKTSGLFPLPMTPAAHPRVGGENCCFKPSNGARWGSSPRGRGKPRRTC